MNLISVRDFALKYRYITIYGAGVLGRALLEVLASWEIEVNTFVVTDKTVSDEMTEYMNVPVVNFSNWILETYVPKETGIFISLSSYHRKDVEKLLIENGITEYLWVDKSVLSQIVRNIRPFSEKNFLMQIDPVSRIFGGERGKPIDRYYIERFLETASKKYDNISSILEVGENTYSKKFFRCENNQVSYDVLYYEQGVDLTKIHTLKKDKYDVFICTQVFNFIFDVKAAIYGSYYLLKPGGVMLATVQGPVGQISKNDMMRWGDYWRFTELSIRKLTEEVFGVGNVEINSFGNAAIATAWVQGLSIEDLPDVRMLDLNDSVYAINIGIIAKKEWPLQYDSEGFKNKM